MPAPQTKAESTSMTQQSIRSHCKLQVRAHKYASPRQPPYLGQVPMIDMPPPGTRQAITHSCDVGLWRNHQTANRNPQPQPPYLNHYNIYDSSTTTEASNVLSPAPFLIRRVARLLRRVPLVKVHPPLQRRAPHPVRSALLPRSQLPLPPPHLFYLITPTAPFTTTSPPPLTIPPGAALTCLALLQATRSIRAGNKAATNKWFRARIYAQGFTVAAMIAGSVYYKKERADERVVEAAVAEKKGEEKRQAWIRELEVRDREDREVCLFLQCVR
ncbi:hypoxia induced protein conserved region-domain-containing protein [Morchella snyderi]|nr:hypoxia induced protein conserved region-domain-containing protein [Morchella snyderi]